MFSIEVFHKKIDMVYPWSDINFYLDIENKSTKFTNANKFYRFWIGVVGAMEQSINKIYTAAAQGKSGVNNIQTYIDIAQSYDIELRFTPEN